MSDTVDFHSIYSEQPSHTINNLNRKQQHQPASQLINTYLSTAAQYLNRTKSFHIPQTSPFITNNPSTTVNEPPTIQLNSARSIPTNMNIPNDNTTSAYREHRFSTQPIDLNSKQQGFVNTLRRSLRKNKDRFYNKRSQTMKSCNSLNTYEQTTDPSTQVSMTPTLICRREYLHNSIEKNISDDESEKNDRMPPLQSLGLNGRNNRVFISPSTSSVQKTMLPAATSLQSLASLPAHPIVSNTDHDEKERLKNDLIQLKTELQKSKETIVRLQKSEEQMRERLAEQAQRQIEKCGKFEDLNQISRPTELIRSYNTLYSQARIDALDVLDNIRELSECEDLKSKLLFSVVVLAFRHAQTYAKDIRMKIKQILQISNDKSSIVLEETIEKYLRTTIQKFDVAKLVFEVENQLWTTLYDYPILKNCNELLKYIYSACRTAWGLVNQTPPYYIEFQAMKYDKQIHERFHASNNECEIISEYIWPCLIDGRDRTCVAKGVVLTNEQIHSKNNSS